MHTCRTYLWAYAEADICASVCMGTCWGQTGSGCSWDIFNCFQIWVLYALLVVIFKLDASLRVGTCPVLDHPVLRWFFWPAPPSSSRLEGKAWTWACVRAFKEAAFKLQVTKHQVCLCAGKQYVWWLRIPAVETGSGSQGRLWAE